MDTDPKCRKERCHHLARIVDFGNLREDSFGWAWTEVRECERGHVYVVPVKDFRNLSFMDGKENA